MEEAPIYSIDLKSGAIKALLQGPAAFSQFSARFGVSAAEAHVWLAEAADSLSRFLNTASSPPRSRAGGSPSLGREERRILLGKDF